MAKIDDESKSKDSLAFHWIKTSDFRTVHVDGAFGGLAPKGRLIHMAVYSERWPIPRQTEYESKDGRVDFAKEVSRIVREGIVREVEVNLVFDVETAESMVVWLTQRIKDAKKQEAELNKAKKTKPK